MNLKEKKILLISSYFPYPPNDGGKVDILNRIKVLYELGYKVFLISTIKELPSQSDISYLKKFCSCVIIMKRKSNWESILSLLPFQVKSRINLKFLKYISKYLTKQNFEFVVVEHFYSVGLFNKLRRNINFKKVFVRVHNDEASYFLNLFKASNEIFKKIFYLIESIKFYFYEKIIYKKYKIDGFLYISNDEFKKYEFKYPERKHYFVPTHVNLNEIKIYKNKLEKNVLFIGSLFMDVNLEAIRWYLNTVHNKLLEKINSYNFIIAGNTRGNLKIIEEFFKYKNVVVQPDPVSLDEIYEKSKVFVNPILSGAGVKIKLINAIVNGLPVVSTTKGAEGTGLIDEIELLIADTPDKFVNNVLRFLENDELCKIITKNAQNKLLNVYNQRNIFENITKEHNLV